MIARFAPAPLAGEVQAIPSKSDVHRLLIGAALCRASSRLPCAAVSEDIRATERCLRALGTGITYEKGVYVLVPGAEIPPSPLLDCGESGSTLRFLLPVAALLADAPRFTGRGRLPARPLDALLQALSDNGVSTTSPALPLTLRGRLRGGVYILPGHVSSQYVTGLLLALPLTPEGGEIRLTSPLESQSYVNITLSALRRFGVMAEETPGGFLVPGGQVYRSPGLLTPEGDWSNAAFFLACGLSVKGLSETSAQGDRRFPALAARCGTGEALDLRDTPDLLPILAVQAARTPGLTRFTGCARLRLKESDRIETTAALLRALGIAVETAADGLTVWGGPLRGGTVEAAGDHRIAMAAAVAAAFAEGEVTLRGAECVAKSYPTFYEDYQRVGGKVWLEKH